MRLIAIALCFAAALAAQQASYNQYRVIPTPAGTPGGATVGAVNFYSANAANYLSLQAPATLSGNSTITLPVPTGSTGCVQDSTGTGVLVIASSCLGAPPITISGSTTAPTSLMSLTQSGTGGALKISGNPTASLVSLSAGGTGDALTVTAGNVTLGTGATLNNSLNMNSYIQFGADNAYNVGSLTDAPNTIYAHTISFPQGTGSTQPWSFGATGLGYAQDMTVRYVFNSMGDVAQTGTVTVSGGTMTGTGFDSSWLGGVIQLCSTTCNTTIGNYYLITGGTSPYTSSLTLGGYLPYGTSGAPANGTYQYSYLANGFQLANGEMQGTGAGYWLTQGFVATHGLTTFVNGTYLGNVNVATVGGVSQVTLTSGTPFDPTMQGGAIKIPSGGGSAYKIGTVLSPGRLTLTTTITPGSYSYSFTPYALLLANGLADIDAAGNSSFATVSANNVTALTVESISSALLPSGFTTGSYGLTSGGALTVSSCTGCGSGVTSVTASSPIASSGGTAPNITISATPTFTSVTASSGFGVPGWNFVDGSANATFNALSLPNGAFTYVGTLCTLQTVGGVSNVMVC